jgi:hypothetical protein
MEEMDEIDGEQCCFSTVRFLLAREAREAGFREGGSASKLAGSGKNGREDALEEEEAAFEGEEGIRWLHF